MVYIVFVVLQFTLQNIVYIAPVEWLVKVSVCTICLQVRHLLSPQLLQDPFVDKLEFEVISALTNMSLRLFGLLNAKMGGSGNIF